ncbi:MAG TPA: hypothetical protein VNO79_07420 [Actinomycetota bacterium]|nr:hypothetical protein [Actinomycetota bacterium]
MAEPEVLVERTGEGDPLRFRVRVRDEGGEAIHEVRVSAADLERLGRRFASPEELVEASFRILLAREPKGSILRSFDLPVIARYFPDYEREIGGR